MTWYCTGIVGNQKKQRDFKQHQAYGNPVRWDVAVAQHYTRDGCYCGWYISKREALGEENMEHYGPFETEKEAKAMALLFL